MMHSTTPPSPVHRRRHRQRSVGLALLPIVVAVLAGCSQIQTAVSDGAKEVTDGAVTAASAELTDQICAPIADGTISAEDQELVSNLLTLAESTGLGSDLIISMENVAGAGTEISASDIDSFVAACTAATPAS